MQKVEEQQQAASARKQKKEKKKETESKEEKTEHNDADDDDDEKTESEEDQTPKKKKSEVFETGERKRSGPSKSRRSASAHEVTRGRPLNDDDEGDDDHDDEAEVSQEVGEGAMAAEENIDVSSGSSSTSQTKSVRHAWCLRALFCL